VFNIIDIVDLLATGKKTRSLDFALKILSRQGGGLVFVAAGNQNEVCERQNLS
jgi:hypothetical protein